MGKPTQVVKMSKSILQYFKEERGLQYEHEPFKKVKEEEFINKLTESLNCGPATIEIVWIEPEDVWKKNF